MSVKPGLREHSAVRVPRAAAVGVIATLLLGCTQSKVDRDAELHLTGTVLTPSGAPAGDARVTLVKVADLGEVVVGGVIALGTFGTVCLVDDPPSICDEAHRADADDQGAFTIDLTGEDTQGLVGQASDLDLTAKSGDLISTVRFKVQHEELTLPPLRLWDQALTTSTSGGSLTATWGSLPADYGEDPEYALRFVDGNGALIWGEPDVEPGVEVDRRLLEDRDGSVELAAATEADGPDTTFRFTFFGRPGRFEGAGAAPSRGRPCSAATTDGATTVLDPCPLTDGDLATASGFSTDGTVRSAAIVDLGSTRAVQLIVARGAIGPVTVETSTDGTTWTFAGSSSGSLVGVVPPGGRAQARYVRVRTTGGTDLSSLAEVSAWS